MFNKKNLRYIMPLLVLCIVGALLSVPMFAETTTQDADTAYEFIELPYSKSFDLKPKDIESGTLELEAGEDAATDIMSFSGTTVIAGSKEGVRKVIFTDSATGLKERFLVRVIDKNSDVAVVRNSGSNPIKSENVTADVEGLENIIPVTGHVYAAAELEEVNTKYPESPIIRHGYDTLVLNPDKIAEEMTRDKALSEYSGKRIQDIRALAMIGTKGSFDAKTVMLGFNQASTSPLSYEGNGIGEMKLTLVKRGGGYINFAYANSVADFTPGHYTYIKKKTTSQAEKGDIAQSSGKFEADCRYYLAIFVKDNESYDWDSAAGEITLQAVVTRIRNSEPQRHKHRDIKFWKFDENGEEVRIFGNSEIGVAPKLDLGYDLHSDPASIVMKQGETRQVKVTDNVGQVWVETFKGGVFSTNTKGQVIADRQPGLDVLSIGDDNHYNAVVVTVLGTPEDVYPTPVFYNAKGLRTKDNPIKDDALPSNVAASYVKYYHDDSGAYFMSGYVQTMLINILGLDRDDISPTSYGVRSVSPAVARKALANNKWTQYTEVKLFPLVETSAKVANGIAGVSFTISGTNLCGATSRKVSDIAIANLKFDETASLYSYAATASEYGDKKFAVKDSDGKNLAASDYIQLGEDYTLTLFVKDGGDFDLDPTNQMIITAPMLLTYKKADNLEAMRPEVVSSGDTFDKIKGKMKSKIKTPTGHSLATPGYVKKRTGLDVEGTNNESAMISADTQKAIAKIFVKDNKTIKFDTMFPFVELNVSAGEVVPIITRIRGFDLNDTDPKKLQIMEAFPNGTGKYFSYSTIADADDGNFALVDEEGNDVTVIDKSADIWSDDTSKSKLGTYYLIVFIKDGGEYDVDGEKDGKVLDPVSQVSETGYTPEPEPTPTPTSSSGGGCNAGFGALALLLAIPAIVRKKK